ncbi:MAG: hypothetical protein Q8N51_00695 [Gammaproteobacteria bacterium]|nr:hypothetical protein [Gammaproteobacteria bacterium]
MSGHTPGPWALRQNTGPAQPAIEAYAEGPDGSRKLSTFVVAGREPVADCFGEGASGYSLVMRHANARLIAAAPDLLEALRKLAPILDNDGPLVDAYRGVEPIVRAAIAKAEGAA